MMYSIAWQRRVCRFPSNEQELLKSSLMLHIDGTSPVAEDIGRQLLTYGRRIPFAELFARIDVVDASTVKRVANRFIFDQLKSTLMLHIDGTSPVAEDIGRQLLTYGRRIPFAELFARIDAVDASTVKRVANRFIFDQESKLKAARMHK
ncbi:mitochondrial processing peptidase [Sarracenia purpurea var. burkii]